MHILNISLFWGNIDFYSIVLNTIFKRFKIIEDEERYLSNEV